MQSESFAQEQGPAWLDRTLFPFKSRFVEVGGHRVHYIDEGSGPTLLMLHGNPTWAFLYRHVVLRLRSDFRCIALDYPGFGLSTAANGYQFLPRQHSQVVEHFVDQLGLRDISIMVQDWGGPIGLGFAGRRPELIQRLILGNTFAWPADKGMAVFSKIVGNGLARLLIRRYNMLAKWLIPAGTNRKLSEPELAAYMGPFARPASRLPTWIFAREILASRDYLAEVEAGLAKLRDKPALIVWGEQDGAFREPERVRLQSCFSNCDVRLLPEAKHFIQENAPDEICAAVRDTVQRLNVGGPLGHLSCRPMHSASAHPSGKRDESS